MRYEPKEGVDYIVDLYAVADAPVDATPDELKRAISEGLKQYHPDRLQGIAPEFQTKGERMARLLNKARDILLNDERRTQYDEIRNNWDGPLSNDGTPTITLTRHLQMEMASKTPEEIEATFATHAAQVEGMTGYNPSRLEFLESMITNENTTDSEALRNEYEDALLQRDRTLAIQELERSKLLGLPDIEQRRYVAAIGYGEQIDAAIEAARTDRKEQLRIEALGGVSTRLALLAGENAVTPGSVLPTCQTIDLPHYFEDQARKVKEIAQDREQISEKRLANFQPTYPEVQLQTEFKETLAVGIGGSLWLGIAINIDRSGANSTELPDTIKEHLNAGEYKAVIAQDVNVLTFDPKDQLDIQDLLSEAVQKYINKYNSQTDEA